MFILVFSTLIICLFITIYFFLTRHFRHWEKKGVPFITPTAGFGNMSSVFTLKQSIWERILDIHHMADDPYTGFFLLDKPALLIRDLELYKNIMVRDFGNFMDREFAPSREQDPIMAHGLFALNTDSWRKLRIKLTPSFTSGKMKNMFYLVRANTENLNKVIADHVKSGELCDVRDLTVRYTTDVISACAFGIDGKSLENPDWELRKMAKEFIHPNTITSIKFAIMLVAPWVITKFNIKINSESLYQIIRNAIWTTVKYREQNGISRNDFLDLLMDIRKEHLQKKETGLPFDFDGDKFVAQTLTFLIAGTETSSTTMSLALYELAHNQEIQTKARNEVREILNKHGGEMTYDGLHEMTYLQQIINETLRKYPVLPFLDRKCTQTYTIPGTDVIIDKGTRVFFSAMAIQNDPRNFTNPEIFDPDRFSEENLKNDSRHKFTFLPFGEGPRNCIGKRFGTMQSKAGLVQILHNYNVNVCSKTPPTPVYDKRNFALTIDGSLFLSMTKCEDID